MTPSVMLTKRRAAFPWEIASMRYKRGSTMVTTKLPFDEWTEVFGSERLTGALLDRHAPRSHPGDEQGELQAKIEQKY